MQDLISRQQAIDELIKMLSDCFYADEEVLDAVETTLKELPSALGTNLAEVSTDAISRWAAINAIDECYCGGEGSCGEPWIYKENAVEAINMIEPMPSAQPKRGKWQYNGKHGTFKIYTCDQCGWNYEAKHNYCPNCGAKMEVTNGD